MALAVDMHARWSRVVGQRQCCVEDETGPATSLGTLSLLVRESRTDPVGGDMTVIDRAYTRALADSVDTEQQNG